MNLVYIGGAILAGIALFVLLVAMHNKEIDEENRRN